MRPPEIGIAWFWVVGIGGYDRPKETRAGRLLLNQNDVVGPHLGEFEHDMAVVRVWRVLCDPGLRGLVVAK